MEGVDAREAAAGGGRGGGREVRQGWWQLRAGRG